MGAVLYRMAEFVSRYWADQGSDAAQRASRHLQGHGRCLDRHRLGACA